MRVVFLTCTLLSCGEVLIPDPVEPVGETNEFPLLRARVDGEVWAAGGMMGEPSAKAMYGGLNLQITGARYEPRTSSVEQVRLEIVNISDPRTFKLGVLSRDSGVGYFIKNDSIIYRTQETKVGSVTIELLDRSARRVAGTFEFEAEGDGGAIVTLREGRFDVRW